MRKVVTTVCALIPFLFSCATQSGDVDYRGEMRRLVQGISIYAKGRKANFCVIPQNGQELVTDTGDGQGKIESDYLNSVDGTGREDLFFGYDEYGKPTQADITDYLISLCNIFANNGKKVLAIDYCSAQTDIDHSYDSNNQLGYISFAADRRELDAIPAYPVEPNNVNSEDISKLSDAKNFLYLINGQSYSNKADILNAIKNTDYDVVVMDLFQFDEQFTSSEISALKMKKNGGKRLIICYLSIGEAEDYRYYWKPSWKTQKPTWLKKENPDWAGNYKVEYWNEGWKRILFGSSDAYLDRILSSDFDGVYLDIIDAFEYFESN